MLMFAHDSSFSLVTPVLFPSYGRRGRFREVKGCVQYHKASVWQSWHLNLGHIGYKSLLLPHHVIKVDADLDPNMDLTYQLSIAG